MKQSLKNYDCKASKNQCAFKIKQLSTIFYLLMCYKKKLYKNDHLINCRIETLYEEPQFKERRLAALVASKVSLGLTFELKVRAIILS